MCKKVSMNHGGFGCDGGFACDECSNRNVCHTLGPFKAVDAACITPEPRPQPRPSVSSIIPFASGNPVELASVLNGLFTAVSIVGFGSSFENVALAGNDINFLNQLFTEAFVVPRAGNVTSIAASFTVTLEIALGDLKGTTVVNARIYRAPAGSNVFSPTNVTVDLNPPLSGAINVGKVVHNTSDTFAPLPVVAGDRLLMVFSITTTGTALDLASSVTGTASAGITID
ncbi:exosporium glycoprotein BclB-related protein [Lysinibacillus xylanilyticus]|uniref:Exosporium glycoprotein BclB-related protein n=1 Tax=Lysinibacillus xylanilyticus TaxID=582475 RepID=A0ABV3W193_9BACI